MKLPVVLVTGANRGIGFEICRQLAARGAPLVLTARSPEKGKTAAAALAREFPGGGAIRFHPLDVVDESSIAALRDFLRQEVGRLDVLINNAGVIAENDQHILSVPPSTLRTSLETNALAPLRLTQALLPLLRESKRGRIVNVSSGAGELAAFDGSWSPAYSLSKAALNLITRMLAAAVASDRLAVNALCPGWVRTDMGGAGAPRDVAQGADTAVWLALDAPQTLHGKFLRDRKVIPW